MAQSSGVHTHPTGGYGNLGRNALRGPGYFGFDLSLSRNFKVTERFNLQARAEAFNILITRTLWERSRRPDSPPGDLRTLTQALNFFDLRTESLAPMTRASCSSAEAVFLRSFSDGAVSATAFERKRAPPRTKRAIGG